MPTPFQSARDKGGRRFQPVKEQALEDAALQACASLPGAAAGLLVVREVVGPFGIPDLVAIVGDPDAVAQRRKLRVPPLLNEIDAGIVGAAASRAPRRISTLAARLGWPVETVTRRIPDLLRSGALLETSPGVMVRPPALRPIGRIYAVETKISDWKRAVRQGRTYQVWCDAYIVVMESLGASSLEGLLGEATEDGAGVVTGDRWRARPKTRRRPTSRRLWGSEHVVAALGHSSVALGSPVSLEATG